MHRCILIAIMSLRFYIHHFPGTVILLGIPDLNKKSQMKRKGALFYCTEIFVINNALNFSFLQKTYLCVIELIGRTDLVKQLSWYSSSRKLCI